MPHSPSRLLSLLVLAACADSGGGDVDPTLVHTVQRGDLSITVRERGELHAARDTRVTSELEGRATLIFLIPEGSIVTAGQKIAELDVSSIVEKRALQAIQVAKAEAALLQARKNVEIMEKELLAADTKAVNELKIAELRHQKFIGQAVRGDADATGKAPGTNADVLANLRTLLVDVAAESDAADPHAEGSRPTIGREELPQRFVEILGSEANLALEMGEMANQILQQIDEISLARADLQLAKDTLEQSQRLAREEYITRNELARDEIGYKRQLSRETVAWNNLSLLVNYTLPETLITLQQAIQTAELGLESARAAAEARRVREAAELQSSEAEFELARGQLQNLDAQAARGVIHAPTPGLVVYGRYDWDEPVFEGMEVRERQDIVILPDITTMVARLKVHESQIGKLALGQAATIKVDAFPSRTFAGKIARVATLPDPTRRSSDPKVFTVDVELLVDNTSGALRPSMNGTVVLDVGTLKNVISVPLPAIDRSGDDHYVWRATNNGFEPVAVKLGGNSLMQVEILDGLTAGDRVSLVRPPGAKLPSPPDAPSAPVADDEPAASSGQR